MPPVFVTPPQAMHSSLPAEFALEKLPAVAPIAHVEVEIEKLTVLTFALVATLPSANARD